MGGGDKPNSNLNLPEMQPGTQSHAKLHRVSGGAEPRSRMTPVALTDPGNWTKPVEEMGPGSQAGTLQEEDLRTGASRQSDRTDIEGEDSRVGTQEGNGPAYHISIRQRSWAACVGSVMSLVAGYGSCSLSAPLKVNRDSPCCSIHHQYTTSGLFW